MDLRCHKYGNKSGKLLARLFWGPHQPTHITTLKDRRGNPTALLGKIIKILETYGTLYATYTIDLSKASSFLDNVHLPAIDPSLLQSL